MLDAGCPLSNLNLVLSLVLLFIVVFGLFLFAMTTYATAFVDYVCFISSALAHTDHNRQQTLPQLTNEGPHADALRGGATNAWGSYDGFVGGLGRCRNLSPEVLGAVYTLGEAGRQFGW